MDKSQKRLMSLDFRSAPLVLRLISSLTAKTEPKPNRHNNGSRSTKQQQHPQTSSGILLPAFLWAIIGATSRCVECENYCTTAQDLFLGETHTEPMNLCSTCQNCLSALARRSSPLHVIRRFNGLLSFVACISPDMVAVAAQSPAHRTRPPLPHAGSPRNNNQQATAHEQVRLSAALFGNAETIHDPAQMSRFAAFCGASLESLTVNLTDHATSQLHERNFPQLRSIDLHGSRDLVALEDGFALPALTQLILNSCPKITASTVQKAVRLCPRLEVLRVQNCESLRDEELTGDDFFGGGSSSEGGRSTATSSLSCCHLLELNLCEMRASGRLLLQPKTNSLHPALVSLRRLDIGWATLDPDIFSGLRFPNLRLLNASYSNVGDWLFEGPRDVAPPKTLLEERCLGLLDALRYPDADLWSLYEKHCDRFDEVWVRPNSFADRFPQLERLVCQGCKHITDVGLMLLKCESLMELELSYGEFSGIGLIDLCADFQVLAQADDDDNCVISTDGDDDAFATRNLNRSGAPSSPLRRMARSEEPHFRQRCGRGATGARCPNLRVLDIGRVENLTDAAFMAMTEGAGSLRRLIVKWTNLSDQALVGLFEPERCPNLRMLDLTKCTKLTDAGLLQSHRVDIVCERVSRRRQSVVQAIVISRNEHIAPARHLVELRVGASCVTAGGLNATLSVMFPCLQRLELWSCRELFNTSGGGSNRGDGAKEGVFGSPSLTTVDLSSNEKLSMGALRRILDASPRLAHVTVDFCASVVVEQLRREYTTRRFFKYGE